MLSRSSLLRFSTLAFLALAWAGPVSSAEEAPAPVPPVTVVAGGRQIIIPAPPDMENAAGVSATYDEAFSSFIPPSNRVLAHFLTPGDVARLRTGGALESGIDYNAQILRQLETREIGTATFGSIKKDLSKGIDAAMDTEVQKVAREGNERMEKATGVNPGVTMDKPVPLGKFIDTDKALGFSILLNGGGKGEEDSVSVVSCAMGPVNGRLVSLYVTLPHTGEADQKKAEAAATAWLAAVTAANPVVEGPSDMKSSTRGTIATSAVGAVIGVVVTLVLAARKRRAAAREKNA